MNKKNNKTKTISHSEYMDKVYNTPEKKKIFTNKYEKFVKEIRTEVMSEIAHKLKKERVRAGLSQQDLALTLNTTRSVICRIEAGHQNITIEYAYKIANVLGKKIDWNFK